MLRNKERILLILIMFLGLGLIIFGWSWDFDGSFALKVVGIIMIFAILAFFRADYRYRQELRNLNAFVGSILNNRESLAIERNQEGEYSKLTNQIYKVMQNLMEQSDQLQKDKNFLADSLADITHQLKTPITSMMVMSDLLKKENLSDAEKKAFLENLDHQVERLRWLVQSLLTISKLDAGAIQYNKDHYLMSEVLDTALDMFHIPMELKGIDFSIEMLKDPLIHTDKVWLAEALSNIIKNSIEHTPAGKAIGIEVKDTPFDITIKMWDEGAGISQEHLTELFQRFKSSHKLSKDSVGIGLAISKGIVTQLGGHIEVFSELKKGTRFVIVFKK